MVEAERDPAARRAPLGSEGQAPGPHREGDGAAPAPGRRRRDQVGGEEPEDVGAPDETTPRAPERLDEEKVNDAHWFRPTHATLGRGLKRRPA